MRKNTSCRQSEATAKPAGQEIRADSLSWIGTGGASRLILATGNPAPDYFSSLCVHSWKTLPVCVCVCV